jgi:penicillin amidase
MGKIHWRRFLPIAAAAAVAATAGLYAILRASLPVLDGVHGLPGLSARVETEFNEWGIPRILAQTREDAFRVLGFVTAGDRLFQMDLLRRHAAGRLAEVLGPGLAESDRRHRVMGFEPVARAALERLPEDQKAVLEAYAEGVNRAIDELPAMPPEFLALGYRPSAWRPEDSLLVVLGMEENLSWTGEMERAATVMEAALPAPVHAFLTPPLDRYTDRVLNGGSSRYRPRTIPGNDLAALLKNASGGASHAGLVGDNPSPKGSNGWVVGPAKTRDGRALLANDMHLSLRVPNIWYRAELHYRDLGLSGLTLPGVPLMVTGSNEHIAWGFTNIEGDFSDLVLLELDPADPGRYLTPQGWVRFGERTETMRVRGEAEQTLKVRTTIWGPVLPEPLLGRLAAVRWTALDPEATDLRLLDLDRVEAVDAALALFNRAGGPPLNALVADRLGNIGWTYSGKIPRRFGLDGSASRSWADGSRGWNGYIPPEELPRVVNPPSGFIVNANQRMVDDAYPYVIGHYFDHGYRAYRITERLTEMKNIDERDLLNLQLDTRAEFYRFYQRLALSLLNADGAATEARLRRGLESWDGFAERESAGLAVLAEFRGLLLDRVIAPYLDKCRRLDPAFRFEWSTIDEPLQQLLEAKPPELLPEKEKYRDWNTFLHDLLLSAEAAVLARHRADASETLAWGTDNTAAIVHPFSLSLPWLRGLLDMPADPLPGCPKCVRLSVPGSGASERLVVAPGREGDGILHMPGGQSGHPLSPHYRDQHPAWVDGSALPLKAGRPVHRLAFIPAAAPRLDTAEARP